MPPTRREALAAATLPLFASIAQSLGLSTNDPRRRLGMVIHSFAIRSKDPAFRDPIGFVEFCRDLGAGGVQLPLGIRDQDYAHRLRQIAEDAEMYVEGAISLPKSDADHDRFAAEVATAREVGVSILRCAIGGRRYEEFDSASAFDQFASRSTEALRQVEPMLARQQMHLGVENHKDWRIADLLSLLDRLSSEWIGICVDTGNSIALLEDPLEVVRAFAPFAMTTHLKDMAVAEAEDGFLLSEVPLGTGFLDLKEMCRLLLEKQPQIRFNLEMITRDPLRIPCLTPQYWATLEEMPARQLAEALARVRQHQTPELPRVQHLPPAEQRAVELDNVRRSRERFPEAIG